MIKSKFKPEIIVISALILLMIAGSAAAGVTTPVTDYIWSEVVSILFALMLIASGIACIYLVFGGTTHKAKAYGIITGCFLALVVYIVFPDIMSDMQALGTNDTYPFNTTSP